MSATAEPNPKVTDNQDDVITKPTTDKNAKELDDPIKTPKRSMMSKMKNVLKREKQAKDANNSDKKSRKYKTIDDVVKQLQKELEATLFLNGTYYNTYKGTDPKEGTPETTEERLGLQIAISLLYSWGGKEYFTKYTGGMDGVFLKNTDMTHRLPFVDRDFFTESQQMQSHIFSDPNSGYLYEAILAPGSKVYSIPRSHIQIAFEMLRTYHTMFIAILTSPHLKAIVPTTFHGLLSYIKDQLNAVWEKRIMKALDVGMAERFTDNNESLMIIEVLKEGMIRHVDDIPIKELLFLEELMDTATLLKRRMSQTSVTLTLEDIKHDIETSMKYLPVFAITCVRCVLDFITNKKVDLSILTQSTALQSIFMAFIMKEAVETPEQKAVSVAVPPPSAPSEKQVKTTETILEQYIDYISKWEDLIQLIRTATPNGTPWYFEFFEAFSRIGLLIYYTDEFIIKPLLLKGHKHPLLEMFHIKHRFERFGVYFVNNRYYFPPAYVNTIVEENKTKEYNNYLDWRLPMCNQCLVSNILTDISADLSKLKEHIVSLPTTSVQVMPVTDNERNEPKKEMKNETIQLIDKIKSVVDQLKTFSLSQKLFEVEDKDPDKFAKYLKKELKVFEDHINKMRQVVKLLVKVVNDKKNQAYPESVNNLKKVVAELQSIEGVPNKDKLKSIGEKGGYFTSNAKINDLQVYENMPLYDNEMTYTTLHSIIVSQLNKAINILEENNYLIVN